MEFVGEPFPSLQHISTEVDPRIRHGYRRVQNQFRRRKSHGEPHQCHGLARGPGCVQGHDSALGFFRTSDVFLTLCIGLHLLLPSLVYAGEALPLTVSATSFFNVCFIFYVIYLCSSVI